MTSLSQEEFVYQALRQIERRETIPVETVVLNSWNMDPVINIYYSRLLTPSERSVMVSAVNLWIKNGESGTYPFGAFQIIYESREDELAFRVHLSTGRANLAESLIGLASLLPRHLVKKIVVGKEHDSNWPEDLQETD